MITLFGGTDFVLQEGVPIKLSSDITWTCYSKYYKLITPPSSPYMNMENLTHFVPIPIHPQFLCSVNGDVFEE